MTTCARKVQRSSFERVHMSEARLRIKVCFANLWVGWHLI